MKAKKKINYGFVFGMTFFLIVLVAFIISAMRISAVKQDIIEKTKVYQEAILESYSLEGADQQVVENALLDPEQYGELAGITEELAVKQWQKVSTKVSDLLIDQDFRNRSEKANKEIYREIFSKSPVIQSIEIKYDQYNKPNVEWNMFGEMKVSIPCDVQYSLSERSNYFGDGNPTSEYYNSSIYWKKVEGKWKIYKTEAYTPNFLFLNEPIVY